MKRVFLIVLDSFGIGALPDAEKFGDAGANTLGSVAKSRYLNIPNMICLGLGNIDGVECIKASKKPCGVYGRARELSLGKDTTVGHWELSGVISKKPFPTYENGFPVEIIKEFEKRVGRGVICNKPYSGTKVIYDYGREHLETGKLIVYTSADSVFQIAAHEELVPIKELYRYCEIAREILVGEHGVARVIARPFAKKFPNFVRTANRRDFSLAPTGTTMLDILMEQGLDVISVGKIYDIFAGRGITEKHKTVSNLDGIKKTIELLKKDFTGLCFTNLVDFDMVYGHRNDIDGYAKALSEFDAFLPELIDGLREDDLLIITADHGCDPGDVSTDHTREYIPLLAYKKGISPANIGALSSFASVGRTILELFGYCSDFEGESLLEALK